MQTIERAIRTQRGIPGSFEGNINDKDTDKGKAHDVKKAVVKILLTAKSPDKDLAPTDKPQPVNELAASVIQEVSNKINPADVSEQTAPYLFQLLQKTISGEIVDINTLAQEFRNIGTLSHISPILYENLQKALIKVAERTLSPEEAQKKFLAGEAGKEKQIAEQLGESSFERAWSEYFSRHFSPDDRQFIEAIYKPELMIARINEDKAEYDRKHNRGGLDDNGKKHLDQQFSKEFEARIVHLFGKLHTILDRAKPERFYEEIIKEDPFRGIGITILELNSAIQRLANYFEVHKDVTEELKSKGIILYKRMEQERQLEDVEVKQKDKEGKDKTVEKPKILLRPFPQPKEVSVGGYFRYLKDVVISHYLDTREYLHNARAIFLQPAGEKGFYAQLASYAEKMGTVDIDEMNLLPDSEIFLQALRLYDKFLEEEFAKRDWRHTPDMFQNEIGTQQTPIERKILEMLKEAYKDRPEYTEDRLLSALSMAIGAARGIYLNEPEKAAYADPSLKDDATSTYLSYYTKDVFALNPFNLAHTFLRFQNKATLNPIWFLPVTDLSRAALRGPWDHSALWNRMVKFRESFWNGREAVSKDGNLFIDLLMNIAKVGGPLKRGGWRIGPMFEGHYVYENNDPKKLKIDYLATWKALENIGYEVIIDFANTKIDDCLKTPERRADLFAYLYKKYFNDKLTLEDYLGKIREDAKKYVLQQIEEKKISPSKDKQPNIPSFEEEVELEVGKVFIARTMARYVAQRFPTKFLRIDRNRFSDDGESRWVKMRKGLNMGSNDFDGVVKDLMMAEMLLRNEMSEAMHNGVDQNKRLHQIDGIESKLTKDKISQLLTGKISEDRINKVYDLFKLLEETYSANPAFLNKFALVMYDAKRKDMKYPFTFGLEDTDVSFLAFRASGDRVLARAIGDIAGAETNVANELVKFADALHKIATNPKHDITPVMEIITKVNTMLNRSISWDYAYEVTRNLAALAINYLKKDTVAKPLFGLYGVGRRNSVAAEYAGRSTAVWEWDSRDIDSFCVALETSGLLQREPFFPNEAAKYEPVWMKNPITHQMVQLPEKIKIFGKEIPLFRQRKKDYPFSCKDLREGFGGSMRDISLDMLNKYLPIALAVILFYFIKKSFEESFGGKKK